MNCCDLWLLWFHVTVSLRSKSLALHAVRSRSINSDTTEDGEEQSPDNVYSNIVVKLHSENQDAAITERKVTGNSSVPALNRGVKEAEWGQSREKEEQGDIDRLFIHLRDNMEMIREFCKDTMQQIPIPEQCVIEGNVCMKLCQCLCDSVVENGRGHRGRVRV